METVLSYFHCNWDFSVIPEETDKFCGFFWLCNSAENITFLVKNIDAYFSGIFCTNFSSFSRFCQ